MIATPPPGASHPDGLAVPVGAALVSESGLPTDFEDVAGRESGGYLVLDSCHSTWLFDLTAKRFRRILKGLDLDPTIAATDWRDYERLELSDTSEAFMVIENASGTRRIRSWRHVDGCDQCEGERTVELSLEDVRRFAHA
jgi:hypothetical protein